MRLGAMMYVPSFIKIGSAIEKFIKGRNRHKESMEIVKDYFHYSPFPYFEKL
jgi:hypothetical protein